MSPSPLRIRMIEDMNLAGLASSTQALYIDAVYRLAAHYRRSPAELSEEEVRSYLVGLRDLYRHTLDCDWTLFSKKNSSTETKAPAPCAGRQSGPRSAGLRKEPGPQRLSIGVAILHFVQQREIVQRLRHIRMIGTERLFQYR